MSCFWKKKLYNSGPSGQVLRFAGRPLRLTAPGVEGGPRPLPSVAQGLGDPVEHDKGILFKQYTKHSYIYIRIYIYMFFCILLFCLFLCMFLCVLC